jgi:hypothetical protein
MLAGAFNGNFKVSQLDGAVNQMKTFEFENCRYSRKERISTSGWLNKNKEKCSSRV